MSHIDSASGKSAKRAALGEQLIKWVRDKLSIKLSIKNVIPMRTLQVLTVEARRAYLDADVMSILRKDFNVDWNKTHMSALEALEALINVIKSNETMSIEMVLANESNKQWWPFAFFHGWKQERLKNGNADQNV